MNKITRLEHWMYVIFGYMSWFTTAQNLSAGSGEQPLEAVPAWILSTVTSLENRPWLYV